MILYPLTWMVDLLIILISETHYYVNERLIL